MSLIRAEIFTLVQQLKPIIENAHIQNFLEVGVRQWALVLEKNHERHALLLSLKSPLLRFHLMSRVLKGHETPFTQKWMVDIHGAVIDAVEMVNSDRILKLSLSHGRKVYHLIAELFPKRPNLYLVDAHMHILQALNPVEGHQYAPPDNPKKMEPLVIDTSITHQSVESRYGELEKALHFKKNKGLAQAEISQRLKKGLKSVQKLKDELERCHQWSTVQHEGQLLQANMYNLKKGMKEITVPDWEKNGEEHLIALDPALEPKDEVSQRFRQSKKLRAGLEHNKRLLEKNESDIERYQSELKKLEDIATLEDLLQFCRKIYIRLEKPLQAAAERPSMPYHEFQTAAGMKIWVGKNAHANEKLTFSYAKGSDWWLHAADCPGSHVVLRVGKNQEPDAESLQDALQMALIYSKAKGQGHADITVTQCKYVSRFGKKQAGKVQISMHKTMHVRFDSERYQRLKERRQNKDEG